MPKIVDPKQERMNILLAFQRCCLSRPLPSVSVREIAREAGISHAKVFMYFSSKKDIIVSYAKYIAEVYSASFEGIIRKVSNQAAGKSEMLRSLVGELYEIDRQNIVEKLYAQIYILGQYDEEMHQVVLDAYADWRRSIRNLLMTAQPDMDEAVARSVLVLIEGILIYRMNDALSREYAQRIIPDLT